MNDSFSQIEMNRLPFFVEEKKYNTIDINESNVNKDSLNLTPDNNKGKILFETINEKKSYEDKIKALNNRINKLEKQEKEINKTSGKMKEKFIIEQKIKADKQEKKQLTESFKMYTVSEIEKRKLEIEEKRKKRKEIIDKKMSENLSKNKKVYTNAKNEKIFWESIHQDIKSHNSNMKNYKYLKIKQEFVENKASRYKSQIEREEKIKNNFDKKVLTKIQEKELLKEKLKKLEEKEYEYISKLKNTVLVKQEEFEAFKSNNLNNSVLEIGNSSKDKRLDMKINSARVKKSKCFSVPKNNK